MLWMRQGPTGNPTELPSPLVTHSYTSSRPSLCTQARYLFLCSFPYFRSCAKLTGTVTKLVFFL